MSLNGALNAVIAMIEDRPEHFKEMLRRPGSDVNLPDVQARLNKALRKYAATQIRVGLMSTLHVDAPEPEVLSVVETKEMFFKGVRSVEEVFENLAGELEGK